MPVVGGPGKGGEITGGGGGEGKEIKEVVKVVIEDEEEGKRTETSAIETPMEILKNNYKSSPRLAWGGRCSIEIEMHTLEQKPRG